ncbi:MAG TPA: hypothetical protein VFW23_10185 [Tepidisphaeraceae bacterium]|nr:hypothetical protein [Tepidisphaeraceae bacterium]
MNFILRRHRYGACRFAASRHGSEHRDEEKIRREDREAVNAGDERQGEEHNPSHRRRMYHEWAGDVRLKIAGVKRFVQ